MVRAAAGPKVRTMSGGRLSNEAARSERFNMPLGTATNVNVNVNESVVSRYVVAEYGFGN